MSNAARKARKKAKIPFERKPKVGTPFLERMSIFADVWDAKRGYHQSARARKARAEHEARQL